MKFIIHLSDRRPVRLEDDKWPLVASADNGSGGTICIRQSIDPRDYRFVVYASGTYHTGGYITRGSDENLAAALRKLVAEIGVPDWMVQATLAGLPPEDIE